MTISPAFYQTLANVRYAPITTNEPIGFFRLRRLNPSVSTLTGYWPLEEGTTSSSPDISGSSGIPMEHVGVTMSPGRMGLSGLRFSGDLSGEGSRAWVSNATYRVLPPEDHPFSVSLWFNIEGSTVGRRTITGAGTASNGWHVFVEAPGPGPSSLVFAGANPETSLSITGMTLLLPGQWHQLTITYDGHEGFLYLDAALLAQGRIAIGQTEGPIYFGGGVENWASFLGTIDEVRTFAHCLSEEEVSLAGYWRLNENTGGLAADSSILGQHAGVTEANAWTSGREGSGVDLSCGQIVIRNDDFAVLPPSGGAFSISMWLQPNSLSPETRELMGSGDAAAGWQLRVRTEPGGDTWVDFCSTNHGGTLALSAPFALPNGAWTKLDVTYNGGVGTLYANGRELQSASGAIRGTTASVIVGAASGIPAFDGFIDELKIYSRERSAAQIGPVAKTIWETVLVGLETNIVLQGFGPRNKPLTYRIVPIVEPTNGTLSHVPGSGVVTYRAGVRKGPDAFTYTVSDGEFTSPPTIVTLSVVQPHWLSPTGGPVVPADGSDPEHAWAVMDATALDAVWRTNSYYDCFFYAPGVYETKGWKWLERYPANPGCKHIGSGSSGPAQTTLKLVDALADRGEGTIFTSVDKGADGFEVHRMVLDCNATNLPMSLRGEPVWLRIPLSTTGVVESLTLHWANRTVSGIGPWNLGSASEFTVCARRFGTNTYCATVYSTGNVDVVAITAEADELFVDLQRRATDIDFYGLVQMEVTGGKVSLPTAKLPDGTQSRFGQRSTIFSIADGDAGTVWTSGPEEEVEITLPLTRGTVLNHIELNWNCQTILDVGRFGPAAEFHIRARDEQSGAFYDVPFVGHARASSGRQTVTFGTSGATNAITTDQIVLILTAKELGVGYYSLRDVWFRNGDQIVAMRIPTARTALLWGAQYTVLHAFDDDPSTEWASQGPGMVGAIAVNGSNLKFTDLKVIGFGTHAGAECFPMVVGPPAVAGQQYKVGNVLVEDCVFTQPAPGNKDGLSTLVILGAQPNVLTNSVARRCVVSDVASSFRYSHGIAALTVEHSRVENCEVGVYFEPGSGPSDFAPISIRSNAFINVTSGVSWLFHPGARFNSIICQDNDIVLNGSAGWGIAACDVCFSGPSGSIKSLTFLNNVIRYADWGLRSSAPVGGILYSDISQGVIGNNVIVLGAGHEIRVRQYPAGAILPPSPVEDCDYLPPPPGGVLSYPQSMDPLPTGYQRAWFNNRSLSGNLIDVLFSRYGTDGPASQQQWPE